MNLSEIAKKLDDAAIHALATDQMAEKEHLSLENAYKVQHLSIKRRTERGEKIVGLKLGFTSKAKMIQMGVHDLIWGFLTNTMQIVKDSSLDLDHFIHPRVEPEIAFLVKQTINKPLTLSNVKDYIEAVAPALEIIDSRFHNFKFSLEDVVADNCSSAAFVVGDWLPLDNKVNNLTMELIFDNKVVEVGNSDAILGNPWESIVEISRLVYAEKLEIEPGQIIMAGAATAARFLEYGLQVSASVEQLGSVGFKVLPQKA